MTNSPLLQRRSILNHPKRLLSLRAFDKKVSKTKHLIFLIFVATVLLFFNCVPQSATQNETLRISSTLKMIGEKKLAPTTVFSLINGKAVLDVSIAEGCTNFFLTSKEGIAFRVSRKHEFNLDTSEKNVENSTNFNTFHLLPICSKKMLSAKFLIETQELSEKESTILFEEWSATVFEKNKFSSYIDEMSRSSCEMPLKMRLGDTFVTRPPAAKGATESVSSDFFKLTVEKNTVLQIKYLSNISYVQVTPWESQCSSKNGGYSGRRYYPGGLRAPQSSSEFQFETPLSPGDYAVVVSWTLKQNKNSSYQFEASLKDSPTLEELCKNPPDMQGQIPTLSPVDVKIRNGSTTETIAVVPYKLKLEQDSRIRFDHVNANDALSTRCATEIVNLIHTDKSQNSTLSLELSKGTYYYYAASQTYNRYGSRPWFTTASLPIESSKAAETCSSAKFIQLKGDLAGGERAESEIQSFDLLEYQDNLIASCSKNIVDLFAPQSKNGVASLTSFPDVFYKFTLPIRSKVSIKSSDSSGAFTGYRTILQKNCGLGSTELFCSDEPFQKNLEAGTYYLAIKGTEETRFQSSDFRIEVEPIQILEQECSKAPILPLNAVTKIDTFQEKNQFFLSCAEDEDTQIGKDKLFKLHIPQQGALYIDSDPPGQLGAAISLRKVCSTSFASGEEHESDYRGEYSTEKGELSCVWGMPTTLEREMEKGDYFLVFKQMGVGVKNYQIKTKFIPNGKINEVREYD